MNQENLDSFLALAEEMRLKGLTGSTENVANTENVAEKYPAEKKIAVKKQHPEPIPIMPDLVDLYSAGPNPEREYSSKMPVALVSVEASHLDEQIKSMIGVSEKTVYGAKLRICKVCGKEGHLTNIKTHIESNHIHSNESHACDLCGKMSRSRNGLRLHKAKEHRK